MPKSNQRKSAKPHPQSATWQLSGSSLWWVLGGFDVAFLIAAFALPRSRDVGNSLLAVCGVLAIWQILFALQSGRSQANDVTQPAYRINVVLRSPHYVQTLLQTMLYTYWALYWPEVVGYLPLIFVQLFFAYLFDMLLALTRRRQWNLGFGQIPVVLSINLFLWFRPEYYFCQFLLLAGAYLGKEFVTWTYDGRQRHIFNPSAFSLAVVSLVLLVTRYDHATDALNIIESFSLAPNFYEVVFLLSLVVQILFGTTAVTFGAALAMCGFFALSEQIVGSPLFPVALDRSVFLGISLLVTDPSTSPKANLGKFLFGLAYGSGIFLSCLVFHLAEQPAIYDKILIVPLVNLLVPSFDRVSRSLTGLFRQDSPASERGSSAPTASGQALRGQLVRRYGRFAWIIPYIALFLFVIPSHKVLTLHDFESPLPPSPMSTSEGLNQLLYNRVVCQLEHPQVYEPFGFANEFANYPAVRTMLRMSRIEAEKRMLAFLERQQRETEVEE